jgi:hypothetical protein
MKRTKSGALALLVFASGCIERKPAFSSQQFAAAKLQCVAVDAYVMEWSPNTIRFHGTSDDHMRQAKCLKEKLAGYDVQTSVIGSQLYEQF